MKREIKIAVVGTGSMGRTHSFAYSSLPFFYRDLPFKATLDTIVSRGENGEKYRAEYGFSKCVKTLGEALSDPAVDVIDICTPNNLHFDAIKAAVGAKKHIYCEKPMVITAAEAAEIERLMESEGGGIIFGMVFHNRFFPAVLRAKELIDEGRLGGIISFNFRYLHSSATDTSRPAGWKQNAEICGGGTLFDLGSHIIDMMRFLCGDPDELIGRSQIYYPTRTGADGREWRTSGDEAFHITAKLKSGALGTLEASKLVAGASDDLSFEINGETGALKFSLMQPNHLKFFDSTKPDSPHGGERGFTDIDCIQRYGAPGGFFPSVKAPVGWLRAHVHSIYSYLSGVYSGRLPEICPTCKDGAAVQRIISTAVESDAERKWRRIISN